MHDTASRAAGQQPPLWRRWLLVLCLAFGPTASPADPAGQPTIVLDKALSLAGSGTTFPGSEPTTAVTLPDDWAKTNPGQIGRAHV